MRTTLFALALAATASSAAAQLPVGAMLELRPVVSASIPTGVQRELFDDAAGVGFQAAIQYRPGLHFVGTFLRTAAHHTYAAPDQRVRMYQYDAGAEFNLVRPLSRGWELKPFVGAGAGARTYDYVHDAFDSNSCLSGYGTMGTELQYGAVAFRLEARDNVFCFKNPIIDESKTRNDLGIGFGIAYHVGHG